ncbi:restriction endonuclease subunit S [Sphingobacterium kyonggiense]|uniref:Restriction endonuclease subunit S n=1 Tax=Sphingobacterium kyonggiense TaxID=714075 RepID=A0ABP7Z547_9SPHI
MSKIDELIAQYCPEGVEWKKLGDIASIITGQKPDSILEINSYKFPYINAGLEASGSVSLSNTKGGTITIPSRGQGGAGHVGYQLNEFWCGPLCYRINSIVSYVKTKFIYYFLKENQQDLIDLRKIGSIPAVNKVDLTLVKISIPPLPVQEAIVEILDKFTALEAELEAELEERTRQYEYYRNELLSFEGKDVEWKTLGDIGEFIRGSGLQKTDFRESGVGCIHYGQVYTYYGTSATETKSFVSEELAKKLKKVNKGDIIITNTSENIEDVCKAVAWLGEDEIVTGGHACIFKHNENPLYIVYCTQVSSFFRQKKKLAKGTKVTDVSAKDLAKIKIPLPSIEEQNRIVAILDKFDALVNDISTGLPAEIKARREQYEYYRGKLLSFEPKSA